MTSALMHHIIVLASVAGLLGCCFFLGSWVIERVGGTYTPDERLPLALVTGAGAAATIIVGLAAVGYLNAIVLWLSLIVASLPGRHHGRHLLAAMHEVRSSLNGWSPLSGAVVKSLLAAIVLVVLLGALPPTTDWDSLMYHLEVPAAFIHRGSIFVPADNLHVAFVGALHMLYLPLLSLAGGSSPAVLNAALAIVLGFAVLCLGGRLFGRPTGVLSFIALWGSAMSVMVAVTPRIDVSVAFVLFLVHYLVITAAEDHGPGRLLLAAALAGVAIGIKYHALLYLVALLPVSGWAVYRQATTNAGRLRLGLACAGILSVAALPWLAKNAFLLGAPLYPLMAEVMLPPWLAQIAGGSQLPPDVSPLTFGVLAQAREKVSLSTLLFDPGRLTVEAEAQAFGMPPVLFALPLVLVFRRNRKLLMLVIPALGYVLLLVSATEYINLRYLIPALPPLIIASVEAARRLGARLNDRNWQDALLLLALLSLLPTGNALRRAFFTGNRAAVVAGVVPDSVYLATSSVPGFRSYFDATRRLNESTTESDRTLLLFEARGYYFDRSVLQDNNLTNWPLLYATGAPDRCLDGTGITHVLVNHGAAAYYYRRGADLRNLRWDAFPGFAERCLQVVDAWAGYQLFRVTSPSP